MDGSAASGPRDLPDRTGQGNDPTRLRISDDDRHRVAEVLRHAAGEGRIDLTELDERLEATYRAKTYADLLPITVDLPTHPGPPLGQAPPPAVRPAGGTQPRLAFENSIAVLSETKRRGVWHIPEQHTAFSLMGTVTLDLREATFEAREVTINGFSIMGELTVLVNASTHVLVDGVAIMGEFSQCRDKVPAETTPSSPLVHVKGLALMGSVSVQRKAMPGESSRRLGRSR